MLFLHESHRLEILGDRLVDCLSGPRDPFVPEIVIPQNPVIGRWLSFRLADRTGISASLSMPLAGRFIRELLETAHGCGGEATRFDKDTLLFRLFESLRDLAPSDLFRPVRSFTGDPPKDHRLYDLSALLADLYDRSMIYRPDLLLSWERVEGGEEWPALLWREIVGKASEKGGEALHRARLMERFFRQGPQGLSRHLPPRLFVFGLTGLPPQDLMFFRALGEGSDREIHLFFLNPCQEYWGDIVTQEEKGKKHANVAEYFDVGHPLLSSWGAQFRTLHQTLSDAEVGDRDFPDETGKTLLARLQSDIRSLRNRGEEVRKGLEKERIPVSDRSFEVVVCSGPVREIELLKDRLLALLSEDPSLRPEEIVVLAPDLSRYIGAIQSVFGRPDRKEDGKVRDPFIPFTVSDRRDLQDEAVFEALLCLLGLPEERATVTLLFRLLSVPAVALKFGLAEVRSSRLREILVASGMRWGRNGSDRPPPYAGREEHTFREGLDRLLLGYACGEESFALSLENPLTPVPLPGDESGEIAGALARFFRTIDCHVDSLSASLPPGQWPERLQQILETFFALDPGEGVDRAILSLPERLGETLVRSGIATPLPSSLVGRHLRRMAGESGGRDRFFSGGVTFGQMVPLRSIPFRVVCLLGMNDADFPRVSWPPSFDWLAADPRPGDRSVREDDRTLFLEALMSARDVLWIGYEGIDPGDGETKEPSVLLRQLLDVVSDGFAGERGPIEDQILLRAPIDPLSPAHFGDRADPRLRSFSVEWLSALEGTEGKGAERRVFYPRGLLWPGRTPTGPGEEGTVVPLEALIRFFHDPVRQFLTREVGLSPGPRTGILEEDEPFLIDEKKVLKERVRGGSPESGVFPWSPLREIFDGRLERKYRGHCADMDRVWGMQAGGRGREINVTVDLVTGGIRLRGVVEEVREVEGRSFLLLDRWPETLYPSTFLHSFLLHLAVCSVLPGHAATLLAGKPPSGQGNGGEELWKWPGFPRERAARILGRYLRAYRRGGLEPLPFDPEVSRHCAETRLKLREKGCLPSEQKAGALDRAFRSWKGALLNTYVPEGRFRNPRTRSVYWTGLAFSGRDWIYEPGFYRWACLLWDPVLTTMRPVEGEPAPSGSGEEEP